MRVIYHPDMRAEVTSAVATRERERRGRGAALHAAIRAARTAIAEAPDRWPHYPGASLTPPIRWIQVERFPFSIPYAIVGERVLLLALAHHSMRPGYWLPRTWGE